MQTVSFLTRNASRSKRTDNGPSGVDKSARLAIGVGASRVCRTLHRRVPLPQARHVLIMRRLASSCAPTAATACSSSQGEIGGVQRSDEDSDGQCSCDEEDGTAETGARGRVRRGERRGLRCRGGGALEGRLLVMRYRRGREQSVLWWRTGHAGR